MRPEDHAAAAVVRRADGALAGAAGALLDDTASCPAADLAAGLGVAGARPAAGELGGHDLVEDGGVDRGGEELVAELDAADVLAGLVVEVGLRHRSGLLHGDQAAAAPGGSP
jgi:hypothetical protein